MFEKKSPIEKEWDQFLKKEERILKKYGKSKESFLEQTLSGIVPEGLQEKLELAFYKAFQVILAKGTGVIEKTYSKEKLKSDFMIREYSHKLRATRKNLKASTKTAAALTAKNVAGAGIEGAALGILGIGLPDIPLFLAVIIRSLYTLCLNYGIDYTQPEEKELLVEMITLSLYRGKDFGERDAALNRRLYEKVGALSLEAGGEDTIRRAAKALSGELLYMKFLQGVPIAGIAGGIYDGIYLKRITGYASLKLERRYLLGKNSQKM